MRRGEGSVVGDVRTEAKTVTAVQIDVDLAGLADGCELCRKVEGIADRNARILGGMKKTLAKPRIFFI